MKIIGVTPSESQKFKEFAEKVAAKCVPTKAQAVKLALFLGIPFGCLLWFIRLTTLYGDAFQPFAYPHLAVFIVIGIIFTSLGMGCAVLSAQIAISSPFLFFYLVVITKVLFWAENLFLAIIIPVWIPSSLISSLPIMNVRSPINSMRVFDFNCLRPPKEAEFFTFNLLPNPPNSIRIVFSLQA